MESASIITISTFRERPLDEGQEIDLDDYKHFVLLRQYHPALTHAGIYLRRRDMRRRSSSARSSAEDIFVKLQRW